MERTDARARVAGLLVLLCIAQGCGASHGKMDGTGGGVASDTATDTDAATASDAATARVDSGAVNEDVPPTFEVVTTFYGRMDIEVTKARVTPVGVLRLEGAWSGSTLVNGELLVVAFANGMPRWVQVVRDPRWVGGGVQEEITAEGSFKFPGDFIASEAVLAHSRFEFYARSGSVPLDTKVIVENLAVLEQDARPIGSVAGADLVPFLF